MANTKITTNVIADDAITGAKIADDAINSEHYTDGSIDTAHIADDQVTLAKMAGIARGKIIYGDSSGNPAVLAVGSNGQVLKSDGTDISWGTDSSNDRDGAAVFNESGAAVDFRIEGDTEQNLFFVDGSADKIGIGTASPTAPLTVSYSGTGNLVELISTDAGSSTAPDLSFYRNSSSPADDDNIGLIRFYGNDDGGNKTTYAGIHAYIADASDGSSDGGLIFTTTKADTQAPTGSMEMLRINDGVRLPDDKWLTLGASNDLGLIHDGSNSYISSYYGAWYFDQHVDDGNMSCRGDEQSGGLAEYISLDGGAGDIYFKAISDIIHQSTSTNSTAGHHIFKSYNTEIMRIDGANNRVGIGTTSPDCPLHINGSANSEQLIITGNGNASRGLSISTAANGGQQDAAVIFNAQDTGHADYPMMTFQTGGTERMRITPDGKLFIGDNSFGGTAARFAVEVPASGAGCLIRVDSAANANETLLQFQDAAGQALGSITGNPSSNTAAYGTSSDYRLKENVSYTWDATTRLKQLKPARFNWKSQDASTVHDGFLAHEVSTIVPSAVVGAKDAKDSDDNPIYQQIHQSKLVPLLVKTIQELETRIKTLEDA